MSTLFESPLQVINIGMKSFKETLDAQKVTAVHVDWKPPLLSDNAVSEIIKSNRTKIDAANKEAGSENIKQ